MQRSEEVMGYLFLNDKHSLADGECYKVFGGEYERFIADRQIISQAYRFEQMFSIVVGTAFEFEQFANEVRNRLRYMINLEHTDIQNGVVMGQKLFSFLSALGAYCEAVMNAFGKKCQLPKDGVYEGWLNRCKCIRNYIIHVDCVPYGCDMNYTVFPTDDILASATIGFSIDKLDLGKLHPLTRKLFDEVYGFNEYVAIPELVANGLCAAGEIQKRVRAELDENNAFDIAKKNQLEYDAICKQLGLKICLEMHGEFVDNKDAKMVGPLCAFPFTLAANIKAIEFLRARYHNFNTRMKMYVCDAPRTSVEKISQAANDRLGFPPPNATPLEVRGFCEDVVRQAYGVDAEVPVVLPAIPVTSRKPRRPS